MKALVYRQSVPLYLLSGLLSRVARRRFFPRVAPLGLQEIPFAPPTGWVTLRVSLCGICGSDLNLVRGAESFLMEPYGSFPAVLGHEVVGEVLDPGAASDLRAGDRVVVEPVLSCEVRGGEACEFCRRGEHNLCERFTAGPLASGPVLGFNRSVSGGMAEFMAAHPSRVFRVPASMKNEDAVLTDAVASALQPVLDNFPDPGATVIVYGAGVIGLNIVRCLRALDWDGRLVVVARHAFQAELAKAGGADQVLRSPSRQELGQAVGARPLKTTLGGGNLEGGAGWFFDCVGSGRSLQEGLLCLKGRGRYVMVATAATIGKVDFSPLWFRELTMTGSNCYAYGILRGERVRTYALALDLIAAGKFPTQGLLTHVFPLSAWEKAFGVVFDKRGAGSVKVALDPQAHK
jgi:threonine dehydrogenase-like Zn-dependent dehydrogenase